MKPALALTALAMIAAPLSAHEFSAGALHIQHPWARETAPGQQVGGVFMTIANDGPSADRLTGATSPIAARVEIHTMSMDGGVMRMRPLGDGLAIPAGGSVSLAPGGFHIMLIGLRQPLAKGKTAPLTLQFARAGKVAVTLMIEPVASSGSEDHHGHH